MDNNINGKFNKDITDIAFNILTLTAALTTISGNFFYNDYGVKYFITLNGLIPIKTAKNIVMFINNNACAYGLTGSIEPGGTESNSTEPSGTESNTVRSNNKGKSTTYFYNNSNNNVNIENLTININFLNCHFNNNG